jgi:hypothetical protein
MFKDLLVLEKQRTWKEAFGFYLAYFVLWLVLVLICVLVWALVWVPLTGTPTGSPEATERLQGLVGSLNTLSPMWCGFLASLVLQRKGYFQPSYHPLRGFKFGLIAVLSAGLTAGFGYSLGMIPTAYLTTIKPEGPPAP